MKENDYLSMKSMEKRINLQTIGAAISNDTKFYEVDYSSYEERETKAFLKLKETLYHLLGRDKATILLEEIDKVSLTKFQISFSSGMKAGATLQVKLLNSIN